MPASKPSVPSLPDPGLRWADAHPKHPSFHIHGEPSKGGPTAFFIQLEARDDPTSIAALQAFLRDIGSGVQKEPGTGPWFALRYSRTSFAIFEAFPDDARRNDHNAGPGASVRPLMS